MAYRVGQVVQQPIPSYGEVMDHAEDQQLQRQDRELRALTLQEAVEQRRAKAAEAQAQAVETAKKQDFLKRAFSTYRHDNGRPDLDAIADALEQQYPEDGIKFRSAVNLDRQRAVQTKKMEFENHRDIGQISGRMLRTANPQNYAQVRQSIVQLDPDADKALPPQFDPAAVQQLIQQSDALTGEFDDKAKAADSFDTKPLEWFGRNAKYIRSQADLDELYDDAALKLRAPELRELKRAYGDQYSPEWNANAAEVSLSFEKAPKSDKIVPPGSYEEYATATPERKKEIESLRHGFYTADNVQQSSGGGAASQDPVAAMSVDASSQNILSQTGLSINAFRLLTGQGSQLPRDQATRNKAAKEAQEWARKNNVDIATLPSQYKTYNDVLSANISRLNNTKIMESELQGTIDNLKSVAKDADLSRLNVANVAKIWAGQQVNDSLAQQYALHLGQLRNELSAYYAATQGRTGNNITERDQRDAELVIKNGLAAGSLTGLRKAIENSTEKMGTVMQGSVDRTRKQVWDLFGVGGNYSAPSGAGGTVRVKGKDGKTYEFPNQAAADAFKKAGGE